MIGTTIAGGYQNTISNRGQFATIGGGYQNASSEWHATSPAATRTLPGPSDTIGAAIKTRPP